MPSGNKSRRGKRERTRGAHGGAGPNVSKASQPGGDKRTSITGDEPALRQGTNKPLNTNANVHHTDEEEEMAGVVCWICAEPIKYYSLPACNHRTCHVCALRLRVLYKKVECTFCKEPQSTVIFTTSQDTDFSSYTLSAIPYKNTKLSIFFETEDMMKETLALLRLNCPSVRCEYTASRWGDLKLHARAVHGKVFCDLCVRFKKVFSHEHALYLPNVLPLHLPSIPHRPRQAPFDETVEWGIHPLCAFCNECFFGDDELFVHMREHHEECFLCKGNEIRYQYFQNYNDLEKHFAQDHFACTDSACQAQKFVVFDSELDLNSHRLEIHGADMSPKDRKEARRVLFESHGAGSSSRRGAQGFIGEWVREPAPQTVQDLGRLMGRAEGMLMSDGTQAARYPAPNGPAISAEASMPLSITSEWSAHELIAAVWNVLDQNLQDTARIINAVVDFLGEEEKKYDLLAAWREYEIESELHQLYDPDPADITNPRSVPSTLRATAPSYSPQFLRVDQLEHQVAQPTGPSSPSSPTFSSSSILTFASSYAAQPEAFPSLTRPRANSKVTPQSHQSHQSKSWASVAALSNPSPSTTTPKKAEKPSVLLAIEGQSSSLATGPSFDTNVTPAYCYPYSPQSPTTSAHYYPRTPQSPRTWASLATTDLSAWTPSWNTEGTSIAAIPQTTVGEGKKGKGKQRQRFASASFSF